MRGGGSSQATLLARQFEGGEIGRFSPFRLGDVNVFCVVLDFPVCFSFVREKAVQIGFACEQRKEEKMVMVCSHFIVMSLVAVAHSHLLISVLASLVALLRLKG